MKLSRMVTVVGCHAEGEVGRVITGGVLPPPGATMMQRRLALARDQDWLRRFLLFEPRGGAFAHANLVTPPADPAADAGFIVIEPAEYPAMSGSNCICVVTVLLETGILPMREPETRLVLDTPAGLVAVTARCADGKCLDVELENVPAFAAHLDVPVEVAGMGTVTADIAYGGAFFCIVDAQALGFSLSRDEARALVETGERIKAAAADQYKVRHPELPDIHSVTFTQFAGPVAATDGVKTGRNAVVISPGKIDRSPCGTGTSARLAVLHAKGHLATGEAYLSRSLLDTRFEARVVRETRVAGRPAIIPAIRGRGWITGVSQYGLDPTDPFPEGYTLSDTWYRAIG